MEAGQRFGEYLLFKRLFTDALGDTFRAGRVGEQGIERVVMLRLFDGPAIDRGALGPALANCAGLQSVLKSPHLGEGVDLAAEEGIPFVAYEYVSGKNLLHLQQQARDKPFPIPVEHALFIIERVALGLSAAFETRFRGEKLVHGFLTPGWVWLSSEGEIRLLGLDTAAALQTLPPEARQGPEFLPYLAPEVMAGDAPVSADDVFSLAAILFELLTGAPLPQDDREAAVEEAVLAAEGIPVPSGMRQLLNRSLGPRDQRIPSADKWRLALSSLVAEGEYNPTTFNLAFFLHTLFRGDIERESEEIEREKTGQLPASEASAEVAEAPALEVPEAAEEDTPAEISAVVEELGALEVETPIPDVDAVETYTPARPLAGVARASSDDGKRKKLLLFGVAAAVLVGLGVGAYFLFLQPGGGAGAVADTVADAVDDAAPTAVTEPVAVPAPPEPDAVSPQEPPASPAAGDEFEAEPAPEAAEELEPDIVQADGTEPPPTPEELEARVATLVARNVAGMEASLKAEYESRLSSLREQLDQAREEAAEKAAESPPDPAVSPASREPAATAAPTSDRPAAPAPVEEPAEPTPAATPPPATSPTADVEPAEVPRDQPEVEAAEEAAEEPEPVRRGQLAEPGPGVVPPTILRRAQPVYPTPARKFAKTATVRMRVLIDENGRPTRVERLSDRAGFGFDEAAERAARSTVWSPPTKDGVPVKMWIELTIDFQP